MQRGVGWVEPFDFAQDRLRDTHRVVGARRLSATKHMSLFQQPAILSYGSKGKEIVNVVPLPG